MKKRISLSLTFAGSYTLLSSPVYAHCPLCTAGAGAMAGAAALMGVKYGAIGVFLGAFAAALGLWIAKRVKKTYIPRQNIVIFLGVYLSTLLPLVPFTKDYSSFLISMYGDYGSLFNRTYLINWFIVGSLLGTVMVFLAPRFSSYVTHLRHGRKIKFQGLALTFLLLLVAALPIQLLR